MTSNTKSATNINFSVDKQSESKKTIDDFMGRSMQYNAKELLGRAEEAFKQIMSYKKELLTNASIAAVL